MLRAWVNEAASLYEVLDDLSLRISRLTVYEREREGEIAVRMRIKRYSALRSTSDISVVDRIEDVRFDGRESRGEVVWIGDIDPESEVHFELLICSGFEGAAGCGFLDAGELDIGRSHPHDKSQNDADNK